MLFTTIDVALASGSPTATLFHTAYTIFRGGPLVEMFAPGMAIANARRAELGLPAIERLGDIHDACACALVALPKEFEPDVPEAANVLHIGPVAGERHRDHRAGDRSRVRDRGRHHPGGAVRAARGDPAVGVTGDAKRTADVISGYGGAARAAAALEALT
jgi:hypothetical protein